MKSIRELYRIGTGPSSSHTMGPRKAAEIFLGKHPEAKAFQVTLYGSLAATGKGHIILCEENRKNIEEIQPMYLEGLTFHYVTDIKEVLALALTNEKVNDAIDFNITNQKTEEKK